MDADDERLVLRTLVIRREIHPDLYDELVNLKRYDRAERLRLLAFIGARVLGNSPEAQLLGNEGRSTSPTSAFSNVLPTSVPLKHGMSQQQGERQANVNDEVREDPGNSPLPKQDQIEASVEEDEANKPQTEEDKRIEELRRSIHKKGRFD